jgi:hypothetical protein
MQVDTRGCPPCSYNIVTDLLEALSYGARKTCCYVNTFTQICGQQYRSGVFYVDLAETVARQQPVRQWTDWVAITWEPQQTRTQQYNSCVFCPWSVPRRYKSQRSSVGESRRTRMRMKRVLGSQGRRVRLKTDCEFL